MKKILFLLYLTCLNTSLYSQEKLVKDLDSDGRNDTVYLDTDKAVIVCKLSSKNFVSIVSKTFEILNKQCSIADAKHGFVFKNNWMRAGYASQFRYDRKAEKIRLIGMSRYEFGNAVNDGSGESSVNLLTGDYIGNWNYHDVEKNELINIAPIKTKMYFSKIYLRDFGEGIYFGYAEKCAALYHKHKKNDQKQ